MGAAINNRKFNKQTATQINQSQIHVFWRSKWLKCAHERNMLCMHKRPWCIMWYKGAILQLASSKVKGWISTVNQSLVLQNNILLRVLALRCASMAWHIVEKFIEQVGQHSTLIGKFWTTFFFVLRLVIVISIADDVFEDEQEEFVCNTLTPGCANVCFNEFSPISLLRLWALQV